MSVTTRPRTPPTDPGGGILAASSASVAELASTLGVAPDHGLTAAAVARGHDRWGPNAVASHRARPWGVLWHQLRSPLLVLLLVAAAASYFVGELSNALIIGIIVAVSVGLGFLNEYRAERAAQALHAQIHHETAALVGMVVGYLLLIEAGKRLSYRTSRSVVDGRGSMAVTGGYAVAPRSSGTTAVPRERKGPKARAS